MATIAGAQKIDVATIIGRHNCLLLSKSYNWTKIIAKVHTCTITFYHRSIFFITIVVVLGPAFLGPTNSTLVSCDEFCEMI